MKTVWNVPGVIVMLVVVAIAGGFGKLIGREAANAAMGPDLDAVLAETANTVNAKLPMMVDKDTRLDSTIPGPDKKLTYYYTLPAYSSVELEPTSTMAVLTPHVKKNVCGITDMKGLFNNGVSVVYVYRGNDAREIGRVTVTPAECGYR